MKMNRPNSTLLESAEGILKDLSSNELELTEAIEGDIKLQVNYMAKVDYLLCNKPDFDAICEHIHELSELINSTKTIVDEVCYKFRQVDLAKHRVEDSLSKIDSILNLNPCRDSILQAMEAQEYEVAASNLQRFLSVDRDQLHNMIFICDDTKSLDIALKQIDEVRYKLSKLCQEKMAYAIENKKSEDIQRFLKIFPMLHEESIGLQLFARFLKSQLVDASLRAKLNNKEIKTSDKLAILFESIAKLINLHQPTIQKVYGSGHTTFLVGAVQEECDDMSRKILEEFRDTAKLQSLSEAIKISQNVTNPNVINSHARDPREIDKVLDELSTIVSRIDIYFNFIRERIQNDCSNTDNYLMIFNQWQLNHLMRELGDIYVMVERFYLNESSKRAISVDKIESDPSFENCKISTVVDDTFFIVKKSTKRSITTRCNRLISPIIKHCNKLLETTFCQLLQDRINIYLTSFSARYLQKKSIDMFFAAINNLEKSCDYVKTLKVILDSDIRKLKPSNLVTEKQHCNQLVESISSLNELSFLIDKFTSIIHTSLYQLFDNSLKGKIRADLNNVAEENPDLATMIKDPNDLANLARSLLLTSDNSLEESLLPGNYAKLVAFTKDLISSTIK